MFGIDYHPSATILGVTFWGTIEQTMKNTWTLVTGTVRVQARGSYTQDPCLASRVRYVNTFLLSNIWYTAQILSVPNT